MERRVNVTAGSTGGVTFIGLLQIAFIVMKLCGVIDWSWLWVLAPLWMSFALAIILIIVLVIVFKRM